MGLRKLVEDALRIKIVRNDKEFDGIPITKNKEDLAQRQIEQADSGSLLDSEAIQKFRTLSNNRQEKYAEYEEMLSDATIAASIEMYADDSTQYNFRTGKILWVESEDADIAAAGNRLIDVLNLNEKAWRHIYSLCTYGDLYLRIYRDGDSSDYSDLLNGGGGKTEIKTKVQDESRHMEEYLEYIDDPATIYDLQLKDKTAGFVRLRTSDTKSNDYIYNGISINSLTLDNVNLYDRRSFVHISLSESIDRNPELLALTDPETSETTVYKVKTGKSILADAYESSQTVKLLEDSMMLSRLTKSALVRILQIEVGDMPKPEVESLLRRVKNMIEQKMALNKHNGEVHSYNSPGPMENIIYVPTKDGKGAITPNNLGGDVNIKDIVDLEYFNNKKLSALKIPKQYLNYDSPEGLGNGTSLTKLSSRYAHTIMRIQTAYTMGITNILNLFFLDKKLDYINKFTVKMVSPSTIEDSERDEQMSTRIDHVSSILDLVSEKVDEDGLTEILNWLFNNLLNLNEISDIIKDHKVISEEDEYSEESFDDDFDDMNFGGEPSHSTTPSDSVPNSPNDFDNNEPPNQEPTDKPEMKPER